MIESFLMAENTRNGAQKFILLPTFNSKHPIVDGSSEVSSLCLFLPRQQNESFTKCAHFQPEQHLFEQYVMFSFILFIRGGQVLYR